MAIRKHEFDIDILSKKARRQVEYAKEKAAWLKGRNRIRIAAIKSTLLKLSAEEKLETIKTLQENIKD
jgi:hypothetical protein